MPVELEAIHVALTTAVARGQPLLEAAVQAWESAAGTRAGLNDALLQLADHGQIQADVGVDSAGVRRVLRIRSANPESMATPRIEKERVVFVVHGRDQALRDSMFQFLRALDLHPMEWGELAASSGSGAPYIGALLDQAFDRAQAVVLLFTPDEEVRLSGRLGGGESGHQPRPNVLFEAGLALGRNPNRTVVVEVGSIRAISDLAGRHAVRLDDSSGGAVARRQDLAARLQAAGCRLSLAGVDWHTAGSFRLS